MRRCTAIYSFAVALVISCLLWPAASQGEDETTAVALEVSPQEEDVATAEAEVPGESPKERAARRREEYKARMLRGIWWNRAEMVKALSLSDAVRSEMDRLYGTHLDKHGQRAAGGEQMVAFIEAMSKGKWAQARKHLDELAAESAATVKAQGELKLGVLSLLSDEQLAKIVDESGGVLRRPWVQQARRQGPGRPGAARRPARK